MAQNTRAFSTQQRNHAIASLDLATQAIAKAKRDLPAGNSVLPLDEVDGSYQQLSDAKSDIDKALADLGGKPCGGGRPC